MLNTATADRRLQTGSAPHSKNSLGFAKAPRDTRVVAGLRLWF